MKIVFLGNHSVDYSSETHHCKTLEALGHEVIRLQEGRASGEQILEQALGADILIVVHTHGWETPGMSLDKVLRICTRNSVITLSYHLDLWLGIQRQKDLDKDPVYKDIQHFFVTDRLMSEWFNKETNVQGHYLPAGVYHGEVYMSEDKHPKANDVIFVGSRGYHAEWGYRTRLVDWLGDVYKDKFTHVGGDGATGTVRGHDLNAMYASSKVAVGDTLCINYDYPYYFSDRLFESTGRGAFTIFPYIKGLEDNFEIGKEIVTYEFNNWDELKQKIDYYIEHDEEREKIRQAGHQRTKRDHTYLQRWNVILERVTNGRNDSTEVK